MTHFFSLLVAFMTTMPALAETLVSVEAAPMSAEFFKAYVPAGFDSNDNVQFVGEGLMRNTCYHSAPPAVTVDENTKTVMIGPSAFAYSGLCLQVVLPFNRTVEVGLLSPGDYAIIQSASGTRLNTIHVTAAIDHDVFAPIANATFHQVGARGQVTLSGNFPQSCWQIGKVKVTHQSDVIELWPLTKVDSSSTCIDGSYPFLKAIDVGQLAKGRYLLYVRSLDSKDVANLIDVR